MFVSKLLATNRTPPLLSHVHQEVISNAASVVCAKGARKAIVSLLGHYRLNP